MLKILIISIILIFSIAGCTAAPPLEITVDEVDNSAGVTLAPDEVDNQTKTEVSLHAPGKVDIYEGVVIKIFIIPPQYNEGDECGILFEDGVFLYPLLQKGIRHVKLNHRNRITIERRGRGFRIVSVSILEE